MARVPLPEPKWIDRAGVCLGCAYNLDGLAPRGACPECGLEFEPRQLVLAGILNRARGGSWSRRFGWTAVIAGTTIYLYLWPILFFVGWTIGIIGLISLLAGATAMFVTSPRERAGAERFCITPRGIVRLPLQPQGSPTRDTQIVPWAEADAVTLRRISPKWRRLQIGKGSPLKQIIFDAGIRCPDAAAETVLQTLNHYITSPGTPLTLSSAGCPSPVTPPVRPPGY